MQKGTKRTDEANEKAKCSTMIRWFEDWDDDKLWSFFQTNLKERILRIQNRKKSETSR